ncbi:ribonuclease HII [Mesoplasma lactucae]|uniref:Ribonuclease HII n=1 Tax=Mesoplasma lactucae ATCC 49193 TaxID=81460 RepID=A0A291IRF7_9MOLU|nr:ribonuclease HII [Mesoplasma lactucae]ATG97318.1 ribonuclease HII [Mesoplasma lactucae ATCC 49193]ATZ20231.1 ribonuclease HII [Mesoplasma lactucae ATCC 49193]MCL8216980.1 Ribonuclease HII [Mesoplasma lactucae ATCC 49193]
MLHKNDNSRWEFDNQYRKNGEIIAGCDEAGRGALAGPIVVASVVFPSDYQNPEIKDSKKMTAYQRELQFEEIKKNALSYSIAILSKEIVERRNPKATSIKGMESTLEDLEVEIDIALVDGEKLPDTHDFEAIQLIKGDDKSLTIAAASVLAKVTRDRIMDDYDEIYPWYGFKNNKGYGTKTHMDGLKQKGASDIHRRTYKPVKDVLKKS